MYLGLKIRIYPNKQQKDIINKNIQGMFYIHNYFIKYANKNKDYDINSWKKELFLILKRERAKLYMCEAISLFKVLDDLKTTFNNYLSNNGGEPKEKSYDRCYGTFKLSNRNGAINLSATRIYIPLLGSVKCRYSKDITDKKICSIYIRRRAYDYYEVSVLYEAFVKYLDRTYRKVGIDLGIRKLITTSDGEKYLPFDDLCKIDDKIANIQRTMCRKVVGSNNHKKMVIRLEKEYIHKTNYIRDALNKITTELIKKYDVIYMEDISIKELVARQDIKRIRRKIYEYSLNTFREMMEYKTKMYGKKVVFINRYYPSTQICSECGFRYNPKESETFICPCCGCVIDRDLNAAINIYRYGIKMDAKK